MNTTPVLMQPDQLTYYQCLASPVTKYNGQGLSLQEYMLHSKCSLMRMHQWSGAVSTITHQSHSWRELQSWRAVWKCFEAFTWGSIINTLCRTPINQEWTKSFCALLIIYWLPCFTCGNKKYVSSLIHGRGAMGTSKFTFAMILRLRRHV